VIPIVFCAKQAGCLFYFIILQIDPSYSFNQVLNKITFGAILALPEGVEDFTFY